MHRAASLPVTARYLSKLARIPDSAACTSAIVLLLLFVSSARAQTTWTVNTTNDSYDGSCRSTCSLRDAINAANADSGDTINFIVNGTITLSYNLPLIAANMTIQGPGAAALTVSGNHTYEVFNINSGVTVTISGLTIANGNASSNSSNGSLGGGIYSDGSTLTVSNSTFSGNSAPYGGGGICNDFGGTLTVSNSTFSGNSASIYGGGIYSEGTLTVSNSTFSGNVGTNDGAGAIFSRGTLMVSNSTFSGNSTTYGGGGGIVNYFGTVAVSSSTFSGNVGTYDGGGAIFNDSGTISDSYNLFFNNAGGDVYGFTPSSSDLTGQDPKLAPLGNYGGPTQTMLPLPGSAAICAGSASAVPAGITTDQRGFPRTTTYSVSGNPTTCLDIGAAQTNYQSIQFTNASNGYTATVNQDVSPAPNVTVTENGQNRDGVPVTLSISGSPTANGLTATTANGNGATFSSLTVGAAGDYTLSATLNLNPATATPALSITTNPTADLTINGMPATVSINNIPASAMYGGSFTPSYSVGPSGDNGTTSVASSTSSTCTVSGGTVNFVGVGTCTLQAKVAATSNYQAATGLLQSFTIGQASATVSISNIPTTALIGGSFTPAYTVTPSGDTGATSLNSSTMSTCTVSGGTVNFVGVGTCTLQAKAAATTDYAAGTGSQQSVNITYGIVALYSQTTLSNSGSTIPIKVQLTNYSGANLSSSRITVTVTGISPSPAPGKAPSGNFTFMPTGDAGPMYQLNVKTTGYPSGTYTLSFKASGDPVTHTVGFVIE